MGLSLIEAAKAAAGRDEFYAATIMELFAKTSDLLLNLPFETIQGATYKYNREKVLPGVAFRGVNEGYVESTGELGVEQVTLKIAGGDLDVDSFFIRTQGMSARDKQVYMKVKALSLFITKTIVKGDASSDPKAFDGLQAQVLSAQTVTNSTASGGAGVSLNKLDELIDAVEDPTHLVMNKTVRRYLTGAARNYQVGGYITFDQDSFGRKQTVYGDYPILIVDKDENNSAIMPFSEAAASGTAQCTSVYGLSVSVNGVKMLQSQDMSVKDLGEMQSEPVYRTRVEWDVCVAIEREMAAARDRNISAAVATA